MTIKTYRQILNEDRKRYGDLPHFKLYFANAGYRITTHYRRCTYLRTIKFLGVLYFLERLIYHSMCVKYGCDIPSHAVIGSGLKIDHPVGIVINSGVNIGKNLTIKSGVVIGKKDENGVAVIGDNVQIGVHAILLGNIKIGNNVDIGAGAIVTHDVPDNAVVINQAAKIHRIKER